MGVSEWVMLLMLATIWGISFVLIEVILTGLPPLTAALLRVGIAAVVLWCVLLLGRGDVPRQWRVWGAFLIMGLLNNVIPFALIIWGQTRISASLASILNSTIPIVTVLVAGLLLADERFTTRKLLGVLVGFIGAFIMLKPGLVGDTQFDLWGQIAILGAATAYAFAAVYGRRFKSMGVSPLMTATGQVTASTLVLLPVSISLEQPLQLAMPSAAVWFSVFALAAVCTSFAYILYFRILASAGATNIALVALLIPVTAILFGTTFLHEQLTPTHMAGMATIALGLIILDGRLFNRLRSL